MKRAAIAVFLIAMIAAAIVFWVHRAKVAKLKQEEAKDKTAALIADVHGRIEALKSTLNDAWYVNRTKDETDDSLRIVASKFSAGSDKSETLNLRCDSGKTELFITLDSVVENGFVAVRVDHEEPVIGEWQQSEQQDALFAPNPIPFIRKLEKGKTLFFEFTPRGKSQEVRTFDVSGIGPVADELSQACHWDRFDVSSK